MPGLRVAGLAGCVLAWSAAAWSDMARAQGALAALTPGLLRAGTMPIPGETEAEALLRGLARAAAAEDAAARDRAREAAQAARARADADARARAEATRAAEADARAREETARVAAETARREAASRAAREANEVARLADIAKREDAKPRRVAAASAGRLTLMAPVPGNPAIPWGEPTEAGPAQGMTYRTAAQAPVAAPCAGRVVYAAPFRSYGQLVILACGGGGQVVLGGMGRLAIRSGGAVAAGAAIGRMPEGAPTLYFELRQGGAPVDPRPFLRQPV